MPDKNIEEIAREVAFDWWQGRSGFTTMPPPLSLFSAIVAALRQFEPMGCGHARGEQERKHFGPGEYLTRCRACERARAEADALVAKACTDEREIWEVWRRRLLEAWANNHRAAMTALLEDGPVRAKGGNTMKELFIIIISLPFWIFVAALHEGLHVMNVPHNRCWKLHAGMKEQPGEEKL